MSFQVEMDKAIKEKRLYFVGDALPPDWYAAFVSWLPLAEAGDAKAQYNIGRCYARGDGIDQDLSKAKHWYLKAAEQNDPRAFFNLYVFYSDEESTEKDLEKAEDFLQRAVELSESRALHTVQQRNLEAQKADFLRVNREIQDLLFPLFKKGEFEAAKKIISEVSDERILWVRDYLCYLDIDIKVSYYPKGISVFNNSSKTLIIEFRYDESYSSGGVSSGVIRPNEIGLCDHKKIFKRVVGFTPGFSDMAFTPYMPDLSKEGMSSYTMTSIENQNIRCIHSRPFFALKKAIDTRGPCFILTACYGNENHPVVMDFRCFRDEYLLKTTIGKKAIDLYYKHGPKAAQAIETKPIAKLILRGFFRIIVIFLPKRARVIPPKKNGTRK